MSNTSSPLNDTAQDEWISLHEASALLGVATSTLRRWGDDGRVPMKRTLGGHRRFPRAAIKRMADQPQPPAHTPAPPDQQHAHQHAMVPHARAAHQGVWGIDARALTQQHWHSQLAGRVAPDRMRGLGQRLLGLLIQYINRREEDRRFLDEARSVGLNYGSEARVGGISMHDTVEAFLFFRSTFSQLALPLPGIAQPTDLDEAAALHARIDHFMNAILLGVIDGFETHEG
ncbi:MAG TPA: helix-turn-helix domain-containing protein [Roseiflexaceae bacterium]|nr:helix-turn-helix domain-containing protein [Roseiflexaceae bacterium]